MSIETQVPEKIAHDELTQISSPIKNIEIVQNTRNKSVSHVELDKALESLNKLAEEVKEVTEHDRLSPLNQIDKKREMKPEIVIGKVSPKEL